MAGSCTEAWLLGGMAFVLEGEDDFPAGVELEGDQDLVIASRDFEKLAESRSKVCVWGVVNTNSHSLILPERVCGRSRGREERGPARRLQQWLL